jgi:nucleotide-binding universal stress UspA family protein
MHVHPRPPIDTGERPVTVALLAGQDEAQVAALRRTTVRLFGDGADLYAMEIDRASVDPELAWGSTTPEVHPVDTEPATPAEPEPDEVLGEEPIPQPLPRTGDSAAAVLEAAQRVGADLVVVAADDRGALTRLLAGSATHDLVRAAPVPVLVVRVGS